MRWRSWSNTQGQISHPISVDIKSLWRSLQIVGSNKSSYKFSISGVDFQGLPCSFFFSPCDHIHGNFCMGNWKYLSRWDKSLAIQGYTGNRKTLQQYKHSWTCGMPSEVQLLDLTSATLLLQLRITRNTGELLSKITWSTENPAYDSAALIKIHRGLFCCESDVSVGVSFCSCWYST